MVRPVQSERMRKPDDTAKKEAKKSVRSASTKGDRSGFESPEFIDSD